MAYRQFTLNVIEMVKKEEYEKLDEIFQKRQLILDNINERGYQKEQLKMLYVKYDIGRLEKTLELEMKAQKEDLQEKIKENKKRQSAMVGYNNLGAKAVFLSKKI